MFVAFQLLINNRVMKYLEIFMTVMRKSSTSGLWFESIDRVPLYIKQYSVNSLIPMAEAALGLP